MRLWNYDDFGEPWLENGRKGNPPLLIVNKAHKKGKKKMAKRRMPEGLRRYWAKHRNKARGRKRSPARRRRRNPWPMAGTVAAVNRPRKAHRRGRKRSNPRRRRGGYRRNPALLGIALPPLQSVLYVGAGFVGVPMLEGFLSRFLPISLTGSTIGKYATRIGAVLGLSFLAKMVVGASEAKMVAIGGGAYVLTTAVSEFAPGLIPATGSAPLSAYRRASLGAYKNANVRQLGAPAWGAQNTARSAGGGGANIVATRFRRFQ
jgi:hypothetical protein